MKLEDIFQNKDLGPKARKVVESIAGLLGALAKDNVELEFGESEDTTNVIDYDSPASDSYKKSYKPITTSEIVKANKAMSEAISGEKWCEGFLACIQLFLMVK